MAGGDGKRSRTNLVKIVLALAAVFAVGILASGASGMGGLIGSSTTTSSGDTTTTTGATTTETTTADTTTSDSTTTTSSDTTDTTTSSSSTTTTPAIFNPKISSDKADYSPGETVTLTGSDWQPFESVHVFVNDNEGQVWSYNADVVADANGTFTNSFALPTTFVALYNVTATGLISGTAKTSFTDGNVTLHLTAAEGVANMTVTYDRWNGNTTCTGTPTLSNQTVTVNPAPGQVNIPGFGGNGDSVKLKSVSTTTSGKTFSSWTSGNNSTDSGTLVTGSPTPCISNSSGGLNGNLTDAYAHFTTSNSAPTVAANNASRTVNEGATATNTGTYSDADAGDNVAITASVGTVTKTGTNSGTWSWSFGTTDGPAQSQTVTITANDGNGHVVTTTFGLTVNNVAPTATFNAPAAVDEGSKAIISLTSPSDPSTVDTAALFAYAFDCGSGYGPFGATSTVSCPTNDNGSLTVKGEIKDKDGGLTEYTATVTVNNVAPTATLSNNGPIVEGGSATISFSSPSDPSSADTAAGFHYAYACNGNAASLPTTYAGAGTSTSTSCSFADQGTFPVLGRIFDKDNGASTFTTNVVVTNANPVVTAPSNQSSNEGSSASFTLGSFSDAGVNDNPWSVDVSWGDGGPHTTFSQATQGSLGSQSHTYADSGTYTVTVQVTDKDAGSGQATFSVTVANVAPTATLSNNGPVNEGSPATISFSGQSDPSSADTAAGFHYAYACDNGSLAGATYAGSGTSPSTSCTFNDNGSFTVRARIIDKDGGFSEYQTTVSVNNVAPTATFNAPASVNEGSPIGLSLTTPSDPSSVDTAAGFQYAFDCGSGYGAFSGSSSTSCPTTDSGSRSVKGKIKDKDGGTNEYTASVTVNNVAPTATLSNSGPIFEGSSATISFSGQSDPSSDDAAAGFHYAYSCTNGDLSGATYAGSGSSSSTSCSFADNGTYPVKARIIDKDGGFSEYTTNVIVTNAPPQVTAAANQSSDEGAAHSFDLGSFSDAGVNDNPWSVDVDWGDGSAHTTFSAGSQGALGSKSHTYDDNTGGGYTVTVKVTDKDGGFDAKTFNVDVHNVAPTATFSTDGPVNEGSDFHIFLSIPHDPSGADTSAGFQYAFDCGTGAGYGAFGAAASATCSTSDNGVRSVKAKIMDKDGGVSEYTGSVTINDVNPVVQAAADQSSDEGSAHSFSLGSFSDPGVNDNPWHVVVDWGDGSPHTTFDQSSQGSLGSKSHTYADNGSYTVSVSVTDKDGGTGSASFTANVANVAPAVTAASGQSSDEGENHSFSLGSFSDPGAGDAPWHVVVDWGDGHSDNFDTSSQGSLGSLSHTYLDNGLYSVSVSVTDKDGATGSAGFQATVANVAPSVTPANDQSSDEGESHSFSLGTFSDPGFNDAPWLVDVDWGDGSPHTTFSNGAAQGLLFPHSHTYADNGTYTVTVTVTDKDGGAGSGQFKVTVANVPPSVTAPADQSSDEGSSHSFSLGSFSDPGVNDGSWIVDVDWGDGHSDSFSTGAQGSLGSRSHTYDDNGSYTVKVKVTDKDGGSGQAQFSVDVANVPPTADLGNDGPIDEGSSATISFSNKHDPSSADTSAGFHYAFACDNGSLAGATYGGSGTSDSTSCSFADDGTYTVRGRIIDKDGGFSEYTTSVVVKNVPPTVTAAADQSSDEGSSHSFSLGSFSDPGTSDAPWHVVVDWGDGHSSNFDTSSQGSLGTLAHTYDDNTAGGYTVSVTVTDKDGGADAKSFNVDVHNVAPTATFNAPSSVDESTPIFLSLTSPSDPSGADTAAGFTYSFDCGDGSGYGAPSSTANTSCPTSDNGSRTAKGKIFDKDGGFTEYTQSVTIKNVPPSVTAAADQSSDEGSSHSFDLGSFTDPGADNPWTLHVDWGDTHSDSFTMATPGTIPAHSHTYDDNGSYTVTVKVTDKDGGSDSKTFTANVANVPPTADLANDGPIFEGSSATVSFSNKHDPSGADTAAGFHYAFSCSNGSLAGATYAGSGASDSTSCSFPDNVVSPFPVKGRIIDKDGGFSEYTTYVVVNNAPPAVTAAANQSSDEGSAHGFDLGSFSDAGANDGPWSVDVDWGDGSAHATFSASSQGALGSKGHTYDDNTGGGYTVTVKVTDKDGGFDSKSFNADVHNVAPTASFSNDGPVNEGSDFHLMLNSPSDPSGADTSAGFQYAFDCGTGSGYGAFGAAASVTCSTSDNGVRSVKGKIRDKDGGVSEYTASVTINNVPPSVSAPADQSANEGASTSFALGSFTDPGADSPWSVDIDWGDGSAHTTFSKTATGSLGSQSHTYADNGSYTVKVKVTDKDGGYGSATFKVTVANVPPSVTAPADQNATEGTSQSFSLGSFSDPGPDSPWAVDVDWGDSSAHTTFNQSTTGSLGTKSHTYPDNGVYTVTVSVTDKDGGSDSKTFKASVANANPVVTAPADQTASEGTAQSVNLGSFSDLGANDNPWAVDVDWGDGSPHTTFNQATQGSLGSQSHTYADNGSFTVTVSVTDKDGGSGSKTFKVTVANANPVVTAPADQSSNEGENHSFTLGSFSDAGLNDGPWAVDVDWGDASAHTTFSETSQGSLGSQSHTYADNGSYTVKVKVTDKDGGSGTKTFTATVANVAPTITALTGTTTGLSGSLVFTAPVTFNGTFKDPGKVDNPWSGDWSWDGVADPSAHQTYPANGTDTHNFTQSHQYTSPGCSHTGTVKVTDKDGASDTKTITVGVGSGAFQPPVTNTPVTNKLKNGQVLPVKIQLTDCSGAGLNNLSPTIRLVQGDQTSVADDSVVPITPTSSSAADTTGVMRSAGSDGSYIYNMNVNIQLNTDYTIVIYPYGGTTGPSLRHVIQATK